MAIAPHGPAGPPEPAIPARRSALRPVQPFPCPGTALLGAVYHPADRRIICFPTPFGWNSRMSLVPLALSLWLSAVTPSTATCEVSGATTSPADVTRAERACQVARERFG